MKILNVVTLLAFAVLAIAVDEVQAARYYKWVDENGVTHYGNRAPDDREAETINVRTGETRTRKQGSDTPAGDSATPVSASSPTPDVTGVKHTSASKPGETVSPSSEVPDGEAETQSSDQPSAGAQNTDGQKAEEPSPEQLAALKARHKKNCEVAKANLAEIRDRPRVKMNDKETGELRYLSPDELAALKEKNRAAVAKYCP